MFALKYFVIGTCFNLLILQTSLVFANEINKNYDTDTLVFLHVLFRHGDRTPDKEEVYPKDPYVQDIEELGYGELLNVGKRRLYDIGKVLRAKYGKFLGTYTPDTVRARSTDYHRTKMSCQLVLAGLYPPSPEQKWDKDLNWQPIPYDYEPRKTDHLLGTPSDNCPNFRKQYDLLLQSMEGKLIYYRNKKLYDYLSEHTGWTIRSPSHVFNLYFDLKSEESMEKELPAWTKPVWPENITLAAVDEYLVNTATTEMRRLSGGFFLQKLLEDTLLKITGVLPEERRLILYSAHEINIAFFLILLDVFYPHIPPFGAYVVVEVHKIDEVYGVKLIYEDYTNNRGPTVLQMPGCDTFCPLSKFTTIVEKYFPKSHNPCGDLICP